MDKSCALDPLWDIQQSILYIGQTVRAPDQQMKEHNIYKLYIYIYSIYINNEQRTEKKKRNGPPVTGNC